MSKTGNFLDAYTMGKQIGIGGFSSVYKCTHLKSKEERAVKIIDKVKIKGKIDELDREFLTRRGIERERKGLEPLDRRAHGELRHVPGRDDPDGHGATGSHSRVREGRRRRSAACEAPRRSL